MGIKRNSNYASAHLVLFLYIVFAVISYIWTLNTGRYNGDFKYLSPTLTDIELTFSLVYAIIPFLFTFLIYIFGTKHRVNRSISIHVKALGVFMFILCVIQIYMTLVYGVGKMGKEGYSNNVSLVIRVINLIVNRFDVRMGLALYLLNARKGDKLKYILLIFIVILSFARLSLGYIAYLPFLFIVCYYKGRLFKIIKKWVLPIVVLIALTPTLALSLYSIRSELRGSNAVNDTMGQVVFGRLVGRLSSFSNSARVIELKPKIINLTGYISPWSFLREALFIPLPKQQIGYGNVLTESFGDHTRLWSYMNGMPGALFISYYHSLGALVIHIATQLTLIIMPFFLANLIQSRRINELVFMTMCSSVVAGDAFSFSKISVNILTYLLLFLFINFMAQWTPVRYRQTV